MTITYVLGDDFYSEDTVKSRCSCDPLSTYNWGFSFLQLFIFLVLSAAWGFGMYILWMDSYLNCRLDRTKRSMGFERGILVYGAAMGKDMGPDPLDTASNEELKRIVRSRNMPGKISFESLDRDSLPPSRLVGLREIHAFKGWTSPWRGLQWARFILLFIADVGLLALFGWMSAEILLPLSFIITSPLLLMVITMAAVGQYSTAKRQLKRGHL